MSSAELPALDALFGGLGATPAAGVALAVSGGSDSTALMVLFAEWLAQMKQSPAGVFVLTVDHGLRAQSGVEAERVAQMAAHLGFHQAILPWLGVKPNSGVQAAARAARYGLLTRFMAAKGLRLLLTAHTAEDQAETLLMRLARGSGLDGLAAMAPLVPLAPAPPGGQGEILLARPLLGVGKAALKAALVARGVPWIEDESNAALAFERSRWRAAGDTLRHLGLSGDSLGLSARRLQRARAALEWALGEFCAHEAGRYCADPWGSIRIDAAAWQALPAELKVRVLGKAIAAVGGSAAPVPLAKLEALADTLADTLTETLAVPGTAGRWTLARTAIRARPGRIVLEREPGRRPSPDLALAPGERALWDGRFWVTAAPKLGFTVAVRALGAAGLAGLRQEVALPRGVSSTSLRALPGFWREAALVAVPSLAFPPGGDLFTATFAAVLAPARPAAGDGKEGETGSGGP